MSKNMDGNLELFVRCEVQDCEVSSLLNSLKGVADDVEAIREEKGMSQKAFTFFLPNIPLQCTSGIPSYN